MPDITSFVKWYTGISFIYIEKYIASNDMPCFKYNTIPSLLRNANIVQWKMYMAYSIISVLQHCTWPPTYFLTRSAKKICLYSTLSTIEIESHVISWPFYIFSASWMWLLWSHRPSEYFEEEITFHNTVDTVLLLYKVHPWDDIKVFITGSVLLSVVWYHRPLSLEVQSRLSNIA